MTPMSMPTTRSIALRAKWNGAMADPGRNPVGAFELVGWDVENNKFGKKWCVCVGERICWATADRDEALEQARAVAMGRPGMFEKYADSDLKFEIFPLQVELYKRANGSSGLRRRIEEGPKPEV